MIRVTTNIEQVIAGLGAKFASLNPGAVNNDSLLRAVATTLLGDVKTRIHEQGKAADGGLIGSYSRKPMYVSVKANPGKSMGRPIGKTGRSKFKGGEKAGQDHTSRYFADGYSGYKTAIGRNELGSVNLSLSGQQNSQFTVIDTANGIGLGWPNTEMFKRALAQEKKYGKQIYALTKQEREKTAVIAHSFLHRTIN